MIGLLTGIPQTDGLGPTIIMMVNGVGYEVRVGNKLREKLTIQNGQVTLYIHTHVKEDALDLLGFETKQELNLFRLLLTVSGVGPKIAMSIIDFGIDGVTSAITRADVEFFTQIPKLGKKGAQKIIIELKNKIGSVIELDLSGTQTGETAELLQTLISMGFTQPEARDMLKRIPDGLPTFEEKLRFALKQRGSS
ncbi:Holliday junction branch migration protein RuvA [Candidatus Roizmanbacteria bacterium]|nr:Holliday junction branch migration protein RuvA [Candidatus Roizmanbacteria bacterium]